MRKETVGKSDMIAPVKKFKARLRSTGKGGGVFVAIPYDVEKAYGKKHMIPVKAAFDGESYAGSIVNMGDGPCLPVLKAIRAKIGKEPGDTVDVRIEPDTTPRVVAVPPSITALLSKHETEKEFFRSLSFTNRKEYIRWIADAKKKETKQARLVKMLEKLKEKKKNPSAR